MISKPGPFFQQLSMTFNFWRPCSDFIDMLRHPISCRIIIIIIIIIIIQRLNTVLFSKSYLAALNNLDM